MRHYQSDDCSVAVKQSGCVIITVGVGGYPGGTKFRQQSEFHLTMAISRFQIVDTMTNPTLGLLWSKVVPLSNYIHDPHS
jgi:hypothetical protein